MVRRAGATAGGDGLCCKFQLVGSETTGVL